MPKIKRIEKIKKHKTMEEELKDEIEREVHGWYTIFPLLNRKRKKSR